LAELTSTVTFQNGAGGYDGTADLFLSENKPDRTHDLYEYLSVDGEQHTGSGKMTEAVMRFDNLFGSGAGQIPLGATIVSAQLVVHTTDGGGGAAFYRLLQPFTSDSTWNSFGDGIQADGTEALAAPDLIVEATAIGLTALDVTKSLQAWANGEANFGWAILPTSKDGWDFDSAEGAIRPELIVTFAVQPEIIDEATTEEDTPVSISLLDTAPTARLDGEISVQTTTPGHGSVTVEADGVVTYTPDPNYFGGDSFSYRLTDSQGRRSTGTVNITIEAVNDRPVAVADSASTDMSAPVDITVLANDFDVDGDSLRLVSVGAASHGVVTINADKTITYTPDVGYVGTDSFTYKIGDFHGGRSTATVSVAVAAANGAPAATDDSVSTDEDKTAVLALLDNDSDPNGDTLLVESVTDPLHGTAVIGPGGEITYTPDDNFSGSDSFDYIISDGHGGTDVATVHVTVDPVNDAPVVSQPLADHSVTVDKAFTFTVPEDAFKDAEGDELHYEATLGDGSALPGWLTFDAATQSFSGSAPTAQNLSIKVTADDGQGGSVSDTFILKATAATTETFTGSVAPIVETKPVAGTWDTADDPAIWVDKSDASKSVIIGTNKDDNVGGLYVYDLKGNIVDTFSEGESLNNVDLRYGFKLGGSTIDLIGATNRNTKSIDFFSINPTTHELMKVGEVATGLSTVYGFTMYHAGDGKYYAFSTSVDGVVRQFEIDGSSGTIKGQAVRTFDAGSQSEGIVVDDRTGDVYVSQESTGIWKYDADPASGSTRVLIDKVGSGHLTSDVEGLTIYYAADGQGYLIASSQGSSSFAVYDRETNAYLGKFTVDGGNGIDDVSETDGIDVINLPLGPSFSQGLLVVHDHLNVSGEGTNFKLIPWEDIAALGGLTIDTTTNPQDEWLF
jgi:myo-inositol-hexaphosphate 3-phosphohydrolase